MKRLLPLLVMPLLLGGCVFNRSYDALPAPTSVSLDRMMGNWFVVASIPTVFERAPFAATASFNRAERGIDVEYTFLSDGFDGKQRRIGARAMVDNPGINNDWTLSVAWPFGTDIRIIHTEPDYSMVVLASPDRKKAWILSRRPTVDRPAYSDIILRLQDLGFNVGNIRNIPHRA
ncbi:MAG: hypothetical protein RL648_622 [Verrucomicrobiota bacterium]|jgi:apolipoprotein D and lipocalin family protein